MSLIDILLSTLIITGFCLGFRTIISDGQILHFIRRPFEFEDSKMMNFLKDRLRNKVLSGLENPHATKKKYEKLSNRIAWCLKPFVICVICFSSAWGSTVFLYINGFYLPEMVISCISSAFILKIINDKVDW